MLNLIRPSVGIVTLVALEHKSAFRKIEAIAKEKQKLVEALPANGLAVLNYDDPRVVGMAKHSKARVVMFGQTGGDYVVSKIHCRAPEELRLTITYRGQAFEVTSRLTGVHQSGALTAALACTHQLGVPLDLIVERIARFEPLFARCSVHRVQNGPLFLVDTVKAPYHSMQLVLDLMHNLSAPRKRIVIGQISDAADSDRLYPKLYQAARSVADQVIFVGDHSHRSKAPAEDIGAQRFIDKRNVHDAAQFIKTTAIPNEIILLKSAQSLHLERIMLDFDSEVRCWEQTCGKMWNCCVCGLFKIPFNEHKGRERTFDPRGGSI